MTKLKVNALLLALAGAALLSGCAAPVGTGGGTTARGGLSSAVSRDPYHSEATCVTERPVTVLSRMKETPLACADLGVSATLDELRDAGWRVVSLDIGEDSESEQHVGFPVTVMIRKLF